MNQFTDFQSKKLSSYFLTLSQLSIGSILLKFFEPGLDVKLSFKIIMFLIAGAFMTISCLWAGMFFAGKIKKEGQNE